METECIWDTPELIVSQISALKLMGFTDRDAASSVFPKYYFFKKFKTFFKFCTKV
jgi:hypothetical protein